MKMLYHILCDQTDKSLKIKSELSKKIKNHSLFKSNLIIVIGGDGFMLNSLKKYYKFNKPFYGINAGSYGFLMNKYSKKKTHKNLTLAKVIKINPLKMKVINKVNMEKSQVHTLLVHALFKEIGKVNQEIHKKLRIGCPGRFSPWYKMFENLVSNLFLSN